MYAYKMHKMCATIISITSVGGLLHNSKDLEHGRGVERFRLFCSIILLQNRGMKTTTPHPPKGEPAVKIDGKSWDMGYTAGLTGQSMHEPPGVDGLSFISGYIEGKADKAKPPSERKPRHRETPESTGGS